MSHPGVSIFSKVKGGVLSVMFRNPFDGGKQKKKTTKTSVYKAAERLAEQVSEAIQSDIDNLKDTYDDLVYDILEVKPFARKVEKAREALTPAAPIAINIKNGRVVADKGITLEPRGAADRMNPDAVVLVPHNKEAADAASDLLGQLAAMKQKIEHWKSKAVRAEAALGRKISDREAKSGPRSLKAAMADFFDPKTSSLAATGQHKYNVEKWVKRFVADLGEDAEAPEISSDAVIAHLSKFEKQSKLSDIYCYVVKFMEAATFGSFDRGPVKSWFVAIEKPKKTAKKSKQWFWLLRTEAEKLIEQIRADAGDYWADAATIQHACGFRPEELPLLQESAVTITKKGASIALVAPEGRRLKTDRSQDAVNVPSFALDALKRRVKASKGLLFPLSQAGCKLQPADAARLTADEKAADLWPSADDHAFSAFYLARLRAAAKKALKESRVGKDAKKIDSKTMRHTCGREMIVAAGFEAAAAVLRHDVNTLRKHYADLKTSDVSTER